MKLIGYKKYTIVIILTAMFKFCFNIWKRNNEIIFQKSFIFLFYNDDVKLYKREL